MNWIAVVLGVFVFFGTFSMFSNDVFAACLMNEDWPDAPCFDTLPVNREEYRMAWAPYYDFKGSDWMEQKRVEMFDAKDDGKLAEWMDKSRQNYNVFYYYHSRGETSFPSEYDRPFFEDDFRYQLHFFTQGWMFLISIGVSACLAAGVAVFIIRRRK